MSPLPIVRTKTDLRTHVRQWRDSGLRVALTPTMGALHAGHLSLVKLARQHADRVVASLFVNPTQFAPNEDFDAYPRDEQRDAELLAEAGCDLLYAPSPAEIYPAGFATRIEVSELSVPMEGSARPTHFSGVATVVAKLLIQCGPDVAVFGEKDYQQLLIIRRLAQDLDLPSAIVGGPIIRDADGLALSSRNAYLSPVERQQAPALYRALCLASEALYSGAAVADVESTSIDMLLRSRFHAVDYFEVRDPDNLQRMGPGPIESPARILAVARLGRTRLLDNLAVWLPGSEFP